LIITAENVIILLSDNKGALNMITAEIIINTFLQSSPYKIAVSENHSKDLKPQTLFRAFNSSIIGLYNYTGNNTDFKLQYPFDKFANLFYDAVCYDEELPEYVQEKFIFYFKRPENVKIDKDYIYSTLYKIRTCIMQKKLDNAVKDFWIKENERRTKKIRDLVFNHHHECNSAVLVRPLITWAENHNQLNHQFIYKIFEYGYITGKRAERAKKKCNRSCKM